MFSFFLCRPRLASKLEKIANKNISFAQIPSKIFMLISFLIKSCKKFNHLNRNFLHTVTIVKISIFTFSLFSHEFFETFKTIWNHYQILRFTSPFKMFVTKIFGIILESFGNLEAKCWRNGSKQQKNVFHKRVLELHFATINRLAQPIC